MAMKTARGRAALLALSLACALAALPGAARADSDAGAKIGSVLATLAYVPLKLSYAAVGLVAGGVGWALSGGDSRVAGAALAPAVRGDYLVTPSHLRGERELEFVGRVDGGEEPDRESLELDEAAPPYADDVFAY